MGQVAKLRMQLPTQSNRLSMVLSLLLPLLPFLQILPRPVSLTAHLQAPTLSRYPSYTVYFPGDRITLTCRAPLLTWYSQYRFFYQKGPQGDSTVLSPNTGPWLELTAGKGSAGFYTCAYWSWESSQKIFSENSSSVSITVAEPLPAPQLTVSPQQPVYITGEAVTLTCSAAIMSRIRFFKDSQEIHSPELPSPWNSYNRSLTLPGVSGSQAGVYSCGYCKAEHARRMPSERSQVIFIAVTDAPPQPVLSVDPPSGAVSEGLSLLLTCAAARAACEQRFHFYKDGIEIVPEDLESEISTSEPSTSSVNVSVLSIPRAGPNISGEFTCGYEENVNGRWLLSPRSQAVTITVTASHRTHDTLLTTGGVVFVAGALAALICCCRRKKRVPKPLRSTKESEAEERTRNLNPSHKKKEKATGAGEQQMEEGSEVTYAHIEFSASDVRTSQWKNRAQPAAEAHVLYSEVVTKPTRKAAR